MITNRLTMAKGGLNLFSVLGLRIARCGWIPLVPLLIFLLLCFVVPISGALYESFWDPTFSLRHYVHFFTVPVYVRVIINSFKISALVTVFTLVLGYPYAYVSVGFSERAANKSLLIVILSFWVSLLVRNYAWIMILGRKGVLNGIFLWLGLTSKPVKLVFNTTGVCIGMVHIMLPFMILSLYAVMKGIDRDLLKAAQSLGAGRFQTFIRVFLPLSLPGVGGGCLMVFIMALGYFVTPALLGGARDTMIAQLIALNVTTLLNWGLAFASAFVLLLFTVLVLIVYNRFLGLDRMWGGVGD